VTDFADFEREFPVALDPTLIPSEFCGVPLGLDCRCCGSEMRGPYTLISRVINFKLVHTYMPTVLNVTDGQTDDLA